MSGAQKPAEGKTPRYVLGPSMRVYIGDQVTLNLTPEASKLLNQMINQTDDSIDDIFRKALAMYKAAADAHRDKKAVGIASSPDVLETEFVGF